MKNAIDSPVWLPFVRPQHTLQTELHYQIQVMPKPNALECRTLNKHHEMQQIYNESSQFDACSEMKQLH